MRTQKPWISGLIVPLMLAGGAVIAAQITEHTPDQQAPPPQQGRSVIHETLRAGMHAREARLASLVKTMDGATGEAKIDTMAAIIRELVQSDREMQARMARMNETDDGK
jgi:hypothetical protein